MSVADRLLGDLDEDQREAVGHGEGPLLVVAGAGSGKTRVLTYRIAWLLARELARPHEILAMTFTNKAAREMVERVEALLGAAPRGGFVGTFHRFGLQFLRNHPLEAGLPERFAIADETEQRRAVERAMEKVGVTSQRMKTALVVARISRAKNAMVSPGQMAAGARGSDEEVVAAVYEAYEAELRGAGAVDFDDMILLPCTVLEREAALRKGLADRFRWLLVDEYQDTNASQARLLRLLSPKNPNLTAVGDEDQSIYRWRGAEIENILSFEETYPGATVVTLGRNYRSREPILQAAAGVIARNSRRREKKLNSQAGPGEPVVMFQAGDEDDEARFVVEEISRLQSEISLGKVAVLFRVNAQSRPFESLLVRRAIPYQVVRGTRFWERAEVKDAIAYLRLVVAPDDVLAFRRAVNVPARGIGKATMDHLEKAAEEWGVALPEAARQGPEALMPRARLALDGFFALLDEARGLLEVAPAGEVVESLLDRSGLAAQYGGEDEDDRARRANLDQLVAAAAEAADRGIDLRAFLDEVALMAEADAAGEDEAVQLSTLHAAKGLEFDVVFLVGMEDGLLPLRRGGEDPDDMEEERRLAYVGMTRARHRLFLSLARSRRLHGQLLPGRPSPFLQEVPSQVLDDRTVQVGRDPFRAHLPPPRGGSGFEARDAGQPSFQRPREPEAGTGSWGRRRGPIHPDGWRPGLKVRHATFGGGVILQVQGTGTQSRLVVFFDRAGRKTLVASMAKLEKA